MDNDAYGHVNNVVYYSYFDTAVNEHLIRAGGLDIERDPVVGYVVETSCRFHRPLSFPEVDRRGPAGDEARHVVGHLRDRAVPRRATTTPAAAGPLRPRVGGPRDAASGRACPTRSALRSTPLVVGSHAHVSECPTIDCARMTAATRDDARGAARRVPRSTTRTIARRPAATATAASRRSTARSTCSSRGPSSASSGLRTRTIDGRREAVGACVVCHAISTSRGSLRGEARRRQHRTAMAGRGVGGAMLRALAADLRAEGATRIDSSCHRDNATPGASTSGSDSARSTRSASRG